jgi:hypothetical protein
MTAGPGRPRLFCKAGCRQADYLARQRSAELGISEHELVVTRTALDELRDKLYVLECAVEDARRDVDSGGDARESLEWVIEAAVPLFGSGADFT